MTRNSWDVFGPESDDDQETQVKPSTQPPPVRRATKDAPRKRKPWAILIPSFEGVPDHGPGSGIGNDDAGKVLGSIKRGSNTDRARYGNAPPVFGRGQPNAVDNGQIHMAENRVYTSSNGDDSGGHEGSEDKQLARASFSDPPVYQHPFLRYDASLRHRGGGRGYVASADMVPGTLLLVERRFFPMPSPMECSKAGGMLQEELCLKWIFELPVPRMVTVLEELRWLHPQTLEDLTQHVAADLLARHEETAKTMLLELSKEALMQTGLDVRGVVRLFGVLQSNGFASGIYLHHAMTNHSCRPNAVKWKGRPRGRPRESTPLGQAGPNATQDGQGNAHEAYTEMRVTELIHEGDEITWVIDCACLIPNSGAAWVCDDCHYRDGDDSSDDARRGTDSPILNLSYLEPREIARQSRQNRLKEQFGFDCDCRLCGAEEGKAKPLEDFIQDHGPQESGPEYALVAPAPVEGGDFASRSNQNSGDPVERPRYGRPTRCQPSPDRTQPSIQLEGPSMNPFQNAEVDVEDADDLGTKGLMAVNVLEGNLDAVERVIGLAKKGEVRWAGLLSELLAYRRRAARILACRHISLARADKLIAKACVAILGGSLGAAESDPDCVEAVRVTSDALPSSFGGSCSASGFFVRDATDDLHLGNACSNGSSSAAPGGGGGGGSGRVGSSVRHFKTRLLAVLAAALLSRRMTQALYIGDCPHPEAGECLAELSQSLGMLLAQGSEGLAWIRRLPGPDEDRPRDAGNPRLVLDSGDCSVPTGKEVSASPGIESRTGTSGLQRENCGRRRNDYPRTSWWGDDELSSASSFERECDKAARRIGRLFDSFPYQEHGGTNAISR